MTGRPSAMTLEAQAAILERLANGESLRSICTDEAMPGMSTVFRFLADVQNGAFREQYARAREAQADALVDDMLEIADDARNDWMERRGDDGTDSYQLNGEHIQRSKLRIDARKWMATKLAPKKYGEKITQEVTGADGAPLVPIINLSGRPEPSSAS